MLLVGVAYFILVQAVDLVVCCRFHLGPIDAPVFQFIYEHLLFVLDSSRSMAELQRLQELKQVLQTFSDSVSQNGLSVGIRVFGSRVVWKENNV